jgi:phage shock protein A
VKELSDARNALEKDKKKFANTMNTKNENLEKMVTIRDKDLELVNDEFGQLQKLFDNLKIERERMKYKIIKMKNRRLKNNEVEEKMCKKCSKEYTEKENMNWSC